MARNFPYVSYPDLVQGPLALEPRECTLDSLPLGVQGFPLRRLLLRSHFSQQRLMGTVDLNNGRCPVLLLDDPKH